MKLKIDHMLDAIYGPAGADLNILASVSDAFDYVSKVRTEIGTRQLETTLAS